MVKRILEPEVEKIFELIRSEKNFILEGGAGSGKTYSLISIIEKISIEEPQKTIVCITYTNNAVAEIKSRIVNDKLQVATIHDFIWKLIKKFQKEIKECLVELILDDSQPIFLAPDGVSNERIAISKCLDSVHIDYGEWYSMNKNDFNSDKVYISHNHILILAEKMFSRYRKLCGILVDTANYIFVDEYQDTSPLVIKILLEHLSKIDKKNIVGFFGDSMQAIYDSGVGNIDSYDLVKIQKVQNRRNPQKIIDLANKFRNDGMKQELSDDLKAPNMENGIGIQGTVKFIYGSGIDYLDDFRNSKLYIELEFDNPIKTKELRLTHKLNSKMAGFSKLFELYNSDLIVNLIKKINEEIKRKKIGTCGKTFEDLVEEFKIVVKKGGNLILDEINSKPELQSSYEEIKNYSFQEVINKSKVNKDSLLSYKFNGLSGKYEAGTDRDRILKRLDLVYELFNLYKTGKHNDFLRITKFKITSQEDKNTLARVMTEISNDEITIEKVIEIVEKNGIILKDDLFDKFIKNQGYYLWSRLKRLLFQEYVNSIAYLREYVSVITQHKVKGSEYENVLVLLDNGKWNQYNFNFLFTRESTNVNVQNRTKKLFYVAITRAMKNLIIYMPSNDIQIIEQAKEYFEESDIIDVLSLLQES